MLVKVLELFDALDWPASAGELGIGGTSCVELLI